eukprot:TRINITY_DN68345_c0_g1_i1.p2 TRINITY_DN68345_c0_g1~~TRINITY_DN68345_c0_g1_i1.p2  ORF type:complete len:205 (-),score=61.92 TRINITY_DN68345_c0_g1_i1:7-621(-)
MGRGATGALAASLFTTARSVTAFEEDPDEEKFNALGQEMVLIGDKWTIKPPKEKVVNIAKLVGEEESATLSELEVKVDQTMASATTLGLGLENAWKSAQKVMTGAFIDCDASAAAAGGAAPLPTPVLALLCGPRRPPRESAKATSFRSACAGSGDRRRPRRSAASCVAAAAGSAFLEPGRGRRTTTTTPAELRRRTRDDAGGGG